MTESGPGTKRGPLAGKPDLINPKYVADGIAIPVQYHSGHGLLLLELLHFNRKLLYLLL